MRFRRFALALLFLVPALSLCAPATRPARAVELTELAAQARPSVVLVTLYDDASHVMGTGTGFFVSEDGRVVTNVHVIEGGARATVTLAEGRVVDVAGVLAQDAARDIAILKVPGSGYTPLDLGDTKSLKPGEQIAVLGSPRGLAGSFSVGVVSALRERGVAEDDAGDDAAHGRSWGVQITAPISPGSSGSPVIRTSDGRVVAVAVGQMVHAQNLNFGVPIEVARALLVGIAKDANPAPLARAEAAHLYRNLGISAVVFAALGGGGFWVSRPRAKKKLTPRRS